MKYFILVLGVLISMNAISQDVQRKNYSVDFGATVFLPCKKEYKRFSTEDRNIDKYKVGFGYFFGGQYLLDFTEKLGICVGVDFVQYRYEAENFVPHGTSRGDRRVSYFRLPVMVNYWLLKKLRFSVGSFGSWCVDAREKGESEVFTADQNIIEDTYNQDIKEVHANFDLGLTSELRYEVPLFSSVKTTVFTKFNIGLFDAFYSNGAPSDIINPWRNLDLGVGLGIAL